MTASNFNSKSKIKQLSKQGSSSSITTFNPVSSNHASFIGSSNVVLEYQNAAGKNSMEAGGGSLRSSLNQQQLD